MVRFALVWALVLGAAVGFSGWLLHRDTHRQLVSTFNETVSQDARVVEIRIETWMETFGEDARAVSRSPVVREFLKTRGTVAEGRWRRLVEESFRGLLEGKPTYTQVRLLEVGGVNEGREVVRLDQQQGEVVVTMHDDFQEKGERSYFREAFEMPEGEVYLSKIDLNREFGEVTLPRIPTVRVATPIKGEGGQILMLIINADLRLLFE